MKRLRQERKGNALVAVLIAGFLIMALGLGILGETVVDFGISRRAADWESAFYAAWAGVEHTLGTMNARFPDYVNRYNDGDHVLTIQETPIGNGRYDVTVTALGNNEFLALSTGHSRTDTRRIAATLVFGNTTSAYYHIWGSEFYRIPGNSNVTGDLYSADSIELGGGTHVTMTSDGVGGNALARNRITLEGGVVVDGDVRATDVIFNGSTNTIKGDLVAMTTSGLDKVNVLGEIRTGYGPAISMPEITVSGIKAMSPFQLNATNPTGPFTLDCTKTSGRHQACDGGYFIHQGDLTVYGEFTGQTVIGVDGSATTVVHTVNIPENLVKKRDSVTNQPVDPNTIVAIVADGNSDLKLKGGRTVEALLYTTDQEVDLTGNVTVTGAIIAHKIDNHGNLTFNLDPAFQSMPGMPGVRLVVTEWHEE